jgi:signal transduction histidine kinase
LFVGRGLAAPLRALTTTAGQMGGGDLSARAAEGRKDEIGALSSQFNRMATQLERSFQELQAERDALRNFIADASHEMRTPLTALRNFVELLQGPASQDAEAQAEFLKESEVQLNRLTWITENLLDLSRLDAGLIDLRPETLALGPWIDGVVSGLEPQASLRAIELVVDVADGLQWTFDSNRLGMALSNLVENAIKFSPREGKVRVEAVQEEANLRIRVEDEGPGISPNDLPHIFSRFYRGEGTEVSGSGLGLAIVRSIVRAHGGRVEVTTEPGQPTRFEIVLPRMLD